MSNAHTLSPSYVNSLRISAVTTRLSVHLRGDANTDDTEFYNLCLSLARGIDYAVANNEMPGRTSDLPHLFKQVCQRKNDLQLQAAVMVLMISVKSACSNGWFSEKDKEELHSLSDEMQNSFCSVSVKDMNSIIKNTESNHRSAISTVMARFFPGMKLCKILCLVEAMAGYNSYVSDLHISKRSRSSPDDKIYLFVAQTDTLETSSCIISPQQVNFLLNGEGVDRRTCVYRDPGPQMPTPVTHMLKYGSNLLQVVGQFTGSYIIVVAFMSTVSNPNHPPIPDYISTAATSPDSDNEIIEGPSRISLKCPISFSRIKIPVKGHSCKHLQCFDFNNYVGINARRPLWRCPHCSQSVCFHDIRIDQAMVKVLKEVQEDVSYVKISSDGSWEAVTESNEHIEKPHDAPHLQKETIIQNTNDIMDLTNGDNEVDTGDKDDKKPSPTELYGVINSTPSSTAMNNVHRSSALHMEDGFWTEFYSSGFPTTSNRSGPISSNNREMDSLQSADCIFNAMAPGQSQIPILNSLQLQQDNNPNNIGNGYPAAATHLTRTLLPVQALPAQTPATDRFTLDKWTPLPWQPSAPIFRPGGSVGSMSSIESWQHLYTLASIQRQMSRSQIQTYSSSAGDLLDQIGSSRDETWRPSGRMRGSLSGQEADALNHFIIHPNQPVQAARPPPFLNGPRPFIPPHLQALMRPQTEGRGPDSDDSMAGDAAQS